MYTYIYIYIYAYINKKYEYCLLIQLLTVSTYLVPIWFSRITCHLGIKRQIYCKRRWGKHTKYRGLFLKFNKNKTWNFINTFTMKSNSYWVPRPVFQMSVIYSQSRSKVLTLYSNICVKSRGTPPWGHP